MIFTWSFTGRTTRPTPMCAQMRFVFGCRLNSSAMPIRYAGLAPGLGNGVSTSQWTSTTSPTSSANDSRRSSAGSSRLGGSPATFDVTNSLWIEN